MCWQWLARRAADDDADGRADVVGDVELLDEPTEDVELVDERAVALFALAEVAARAIPAPAASPATATAAPIASRPSAPANPPRDITPSFWLGSGMPSLGRQCPGATWPKPAARLSGLSQPGRERRAG